MAISKATAELSQTLGRAPTVRELATHMGVSEDEVLDGIESAQAYSILSLDGASDAESEAPALVGFLGHRRRGVWRTWSTARHCASCWLRYERERQIIPAALLPQQDAVGDRRRGRGLRCM